AVRVRRYRVLQNIQGGRTDYEDLQLLVRDLMQMLYED
ncbi:hypothetical protein AALP_AAs70149U000100, partial [Arabis alpina]